MIFKKKKNKKYNVKVSFYNFLRKNEGEKEYFVEANNEKKAKKKAISLAEKESRDPHRTFSAYDIQKR